MLDKSAAIEADPDPAETQDWLASLDSLIAHAGPRRARQILDALGARARELDVLTDAAPFSNYRNTVELDEQPVYPGDLDIETRLTACLRWNALAMVVRANRAYGELGGHIASYASVAEIFEVGFHHFFRASPDGRGDDLVFFQPHSAPGVYARAYLEGRLSETQLERYRVRIRRRPQGRPLWAVGVGREDSSLS